MSVCAHVHISGRVQGVYFRANTMEQALDLNLYGWVKNLSDGRVEAIFAGEPKAVHAVIEWCKKGPSAARVDEVEVDWIEEPGNLGPFHIK